MERGTCKEHSVCHFDMLCGKGQLATACMIANDFLVQTATSIEVLDCCELEKQGQYRSEEGIGLQVMEMQSSSNMSRSEAVQTSNGMESV